MPDPIIVPDRPARAEGQHPIAATGQSFVVHEWSGSGPDYLHVHHADDEAWHILEGTLTFRFSDRTVEAPAGTTVFVSAGVAHSYYEATGPTRYLIILTPRLNELIGALPGAPLKVTGITWGLLLVLTLIILLNTNGTLDVAAVLALSTGVALVVSVLLFRWATVLWQWRRRQSSLEAYLSLGGFILCGWYAAVNWTVGGRRKITYTAGDPGVLFFDVGTGRGTRVLEVPVPAGHEAEAQHLTLNMRVPRA